MDVMVGCSIEQLAFGIQQRSPDRITFCCLIFDSGFVVGVVVSMSRFLRKVHYNTWFMTTCCNEPAAAVDGPQTQLPEVPSEG